MDNFQFMPNWMVAGVASLFELAKKYHILLCAGSMPEKGFLRADYNTAYVFDRDGRQIARSAAHLSISTSKAARLQGVETLTAGDRITTFETEFGTLACVFVSIFAS